MNDRTFHALMHNSSVCLPFRLVTFNLVTVIRPSCRTRFAYTWIPWLYTRKIDIMVDTPISVRLIVLDLMCTKMNGKNTILRIVDLLVQSIRHNINSIGLTSIELFSRFIEND